MKLQFIRPAIMDTSRQPVHLHGLVIFEHVNTKVSLTNTIYYIHG